MADKVMISQKLMVIPAIYVIASIVAIAIISLLTQGDIHPDYWKFGTLEKAILCLLFATYGLIVFNSFRRSQKVEKQGNKSASPN